MKNVLIVGYGVVGHNLYNDLIKLKPDIYDKFKTGYNTKRDIKYDFAFICVDTPFNEKEIAILQKYVMQSRKMMQMYMLSSQLFYLEQQKELLKKLVRM